MSMQTIHTFSDTHFKTNEHVTTSMSQNIKEAFGRVKQDMRRLQNQIDIIRENQEAIREEIEEFREREDTLYQVQEQAERIADLQEDLDKYNE